MRTTRIALGAALSLLAGAALAADAVRVGVIYPLTGPVAQPGKDVLAAVKVAQDIVNNSHDLDLPLAATEGLPNLGGAKIELVVADHQGKPEIGRGEAERLITSENVVAIFGAYHSSVSAAASVSAISRFEGQMSFRWTGLPSAVSPSGSLTMSALSEPAMA